MTAKYTTTHKKLTGFNDAALITAAQNANLKAFNRVVLLYQDELFALALWLLADQDCAEVITQNTFLAVYNGLSRFRNGPIRRWLYQIATNACFDELHRRENHPLQPSGFQVEPEELPMSGNDFSYSILSPEIENERYDLEQSVQQALQQLDAYQRAVVVLVDLQNFGYREAALILGVPVGTVKSHLAQARLRLHQILSTLGAIKQLS